MAKRRPLRAEDVKTHLCIRVGGDIVCIDNWPKEAKEKIAARLMARLIPILNPGYEAVVDPSVYDLDVREYIKPEDIVVFPYMEKEKEQKEARGG